MSEEKDVILLPQEKRKRSPFIFIAILGALLLGIYYGLKMNGIDMVNTTEETTITNNPTSTKTWEEFKEEQKKIQAEENRLEQKAEAYLKQFINFKSQDKTLNKGEKNFIIDMNQKMEKDGILKDPKQYFHFMNSTFKLYQTLSGKSATNKKVDQTISNLFKKENEELFEFTNKNPNTEQWMDYLNYDKMD